VPDISAGVFLHINKEQTTETSIWEQSNRQYDGHPTALLSNRAIENIHKATKRTIATLPPLPTRPVIYHRPVMMGIITMVPKKTMTFISIITAQGETTAVVVGENTEEQVY
jgi:hypothetical protein